MNKINYHTHTYRCKHAEGTEEEYIIEAIKSGLTKLGFSDHGPYPDDRFGLRMQFSELQSYIDTIKNLKELYKSSINTFIGLEIEYDPKCNSYYEDLLEKFNLDYLVLGQHIYSHNNQFVNTYFLDDTSQYIDYANSIRDALKSGYFKILAHPDLIFLNELPWDKNCDLACDIIIDSAKKYNVPLEFNANGLRRGLKAYPNSEIRYPYPHKIFFEKVAKQGLGVIINSDCHNPNQIWDKYMDKSYKLANDLNLNLIYDLL